MVINLNKKKVNKEDLLEKVSPSDIFRYYTGEPVNLVGNMKSPLRKDKEPSFGYFIGKQGELCFKDFVLGGGDCIRFVQLMFGLNFFEAMSKIVTDFGLENYFLISNAVGEGTKAIITNKRLVADNERTSIGKKRREWTSFDLSYWQQFNIDYQTLLKYNVEPVSHVFIGSSIISTDKYAYCYIERKEKETYKIYQPYSKKYKWLNNHDDSVWQGWEQLPETGEDLIITKSLKDVMSIVNTTDIPAVSLQAESVHPKEAVIEDLKRRFKNVYVLYDNDFDKEINWGIELGRKLAEEFKLQMIIIPEKYKSKDFSDLIKDHGVEVAKRIINNEIQLPF